MSEDLRDLDREMAVAEHMLPAWFVGRMMSDEWYFGLMLTNGTTIGITHIDAVRLDAAGELWIDVRMLDPKLGPAVRVMKAPTSRLEASIQVRHIVAAFEIADT